ncbi:hypothetical protein HU200_045591 [Digitaria exilis]|uniref:RING-type domain-containing protein n=1 Tax=Digitaria exilis TaxID=1010633 RepID=A0A835AXG4_9POAL|nr:hypothetical protein HU200_045591 [Digitaria exilis]
MAASAALLLLPPVSVVIIAMVCRVASRSQLVAAEKGGELPAVALYNKRSGGDEECVLCLSGMEEGSEVRDLNCCHLFHRDRLDRWLLLAATCPLCRRRCLIPEEEDDSEEDMLMLFMACVHSRMQHLALALLMDYVCPRAGAMHVPVGAARYLFRCFLFYSSSFVFP